MANRNRNTRAKGVSASDKLCDLEDKAHDEIFGLQHMAELLELMGECVGTPGASYSDLELQKVGLRMEYIAHIVKRHADAASEVLSDIRSVAERLPKGAKPPADALPALRVVAPTDGDAA